MPTSPAEARPAISTLAWATSLGPGRLPWPTGPSRTVLRRAVAPPGAHATATQGAKSRQSWSWFARPSAGPSSELDWPDTPPQRSANEDRTWARGRGNKYLPPSTCPVIKNVQRLSPSVQHRTSHRIRIGSFLLEMMLQEARGLARAVVSRLPFCTAPQSNGIRLLSRLGRISRGASGTRSCTYAQSSIWVLQQTTGRKR